MGGFLTMSGIAGAELSEAERAFRGYAKEHHGTFARDRDGIGFPDGIVITPGAPGRLSILYPEWLDDCDRFAARLSTTLAAPVFLFHIHDGDFWMYSLFVAGKEVDHFNPIPDYWDDDLSARERKRCAGSARKLAKHWPDLKPASIKRYLVSWKLRSDNPGKAYPDDQFGYNDCRQLIDFMRRLGLAFPIDDDNAVGETDSFDIG